MLDTLGLASRTLLGEVPYIIQGVFLLQNAVLSSLNDHCILKAIVILDLLIS